MIDLIVMLTKNDKTIKDAMSVFCSAKNSKAKYFGFKEEGLGLGQLKELSSAIKQSGKIPVLEAVVYDEKNALKSVQIAKELGCEALLGTCFFDSVFGLCRDFGLEYYPYVGKVEERPSVLNGSMEDISNHCYEVLQKGVKGINLLAFRHESIDGALLLEEVASKMLDFLSSKNYTSLPLCIAGSVDSYEKLSLIKRLKPRFFTIGTAFFENKFANTLQEQIDKVCEFISQDL